MAYYWNLLWDWDTLESVRKVHSFFEGWALVFFALLVLFELLAHLSEDHKIRAKLFERIGLGFFAVAVLSEIFAYPYSRRNDTLASKADGEQRLKIANLDTSTQTLKTAAEMARNQAEGFKAQIAGSDARVKSAEARVAVAKVASDQAVAKVSTADARIKEAEAQAAEAKLETARITRDNLVLEADILKLREKIADRHLTRQQQLGLAAKLVQFQRERLQVELNNSDGEVEGFGKDIAGSFWLVATNSVATSTGFSGMQVWIREGATPHDMAFATALASALREWFPGTIGPIPEPRRTVMGGGGQALTPPAMVVLAISKKP